jgi:hypothetical protein
VGVVVRVISERREVGGATEVQRYERAKERKSERVKEGRSKRGVEICGGAEVQRCAVRGARCQDDRERRGACYG